MLAETLLRPSRTKRNRNPLFSVDLYKKETWGIEMEKLLEGIVSFRSQDFEEHKELFGKLKGSQKPHTLFIGCSDSRVVPHLITQTLPGELFVVRNVANMVPPYRKTEEYVSTTSAIEYAVKILNVEHIVVCGHSNCGGCAALYLPESSLAEIPYTRKWLTLAGETRERVSKIVSDDDLAAREWMTEQVNVVEQLKHLLSYPFIREKYQRQKIEIYGWHYIIETGEVFIYDKEKGYFELAN